MADTRLEPVVLSEDERRTLENWVKRRSTAQGLALRARIVLACGGSNVAVAARLRIDRKTVARWRGRFLELRLDGLTDDPRPGAPRSVTDAQVEDVVVRTLEQVPEGSTRPARRPEHRRRQGHQQAVRAAYGHRLPRLPGPDRPGSRARPGSPRHLRQPLHPQGPGGAQLAAGPPPLRAALHARLLLLDQPDPEHWFAEIQRRCLDRGVFCSLEDLTTALQEWIKLWNDSARPFKWTKTPDQIIDSICRYCDRISRPAY